MELWERAEALDTLDELLRTSATAGRVALVAGEAGLGKSALVTEFAARCGPDAWVVWGACDRLVTPRALGPLHDIGRQTGGTLSEMLRSGAAQEEIFTAFLDELAAEPQRRRPVVVVEDAHWADEATLDWLAFLGRRMARLPALLVVTYRDDEVGPEHPLRRVLAALPSALVQRVALPVLSQECVLEQASGAGRDPELVYRLSGGNPLLVTELLKTDDPAVPGAVQDLILDRLLHLTPSARDFAQLVAVVPTRADAVIVGDSDDVELCIDAGVLVPSGDGVSYRHELMRSAVEDSLSPTRRTSLHRRVLATLTDAEDIDPGRLVHHARLAGDADAVLRWGLVAGESAARQGAHREAAAHYRAAADYADRLADTDRAEMFERYGFVAYLAGLNEESLRAREAALTVREALGQPELVGENLRWISRMSWWIGRSEEAREAAARAIAVLEAGPATRALAMAYGNMAQLHLTGHGWEEGIVWGERAKALAERLGDVETLVDATTTANTARLAQGDPAGWAALEEVHELADRHGFTHHASRAMMNMAAVMPDELAQYEDAAPLVERALAYAKKHDLDGHACHMYGVRARVRLERGDWSGAMADADEALTQPRVLGINSVLPLVVRGRIQGARGDSDARATLDEAARHAEAIGEVTMVVPVADALSEHSLWYGDAARAREEARLGLELALAESGNPFFVGRLAYRLWRAGGTDSVPDVAAEPFKMMVRGEWEAAAAAWAARGGTLLEAEALALGDLDAASRALRVLDDLGAVRAAAVVRGELRDRGIVGVPRGPRRATVANAAGLTPRQADVLALLVEGLSNAEIASRLTLSIRTVDHHVSALLMKLGVANRGQAAAVAYELNLAQGSQVR